MNKCALCQHDRPLSNSHIIPEFIYSSLYDEDIHRLHVLSAAHREAHEYAQKGIREKLLCSCCETKLSKYEMYASEVFSGKLKPVGDQKNGWVELNGLDYARFKLFALSIIWRAGVSTLEFFRAVKLGPHQERLRQMIYNGAPGPPLTYGFALSPITGLEGRASNIIMQPDKIRVDSHYAYRFIFAGFVWCFFVTSHRPSARLSRLFLDQNGRIIMIEVPFQKLRYVRKFMLDVARRVRA